jgi:bifunctional non-homologous end joining protein LigD
MMATAASVLPAGAEWTYEVKWDGYRAEAVKRGATVTLASRNLKNITKQYPSVVAAAAGIRARDAVLDGEIVALDAEGRPSFQALHHAQTEGVAIVYYAFDLLHVDGRDLVREPLEARRAALREVLAGSAVLLSDALPGARDRIVQAVQAMGLEGVVAKRRRSSYAVGRRSDAWIKVRFSKRQELVIGGFKPAGSDFDSLVVGYYALDNERIDRQRVRAARSDEGRAQALRRTLLSAGKVRNGFTPALRANLPSSKSSHWGEGITAEEMTQLRWVKPMLVAEISFTEWTRDGSLRHAAFVALRDDKNPEEVRREERG